MQNDHPGDLLCGNAEGWSCKFSSLSEISLSGSSRWWIPLSEYNPQQVITLHSIKLDLIDKATKLMCVKIILIHFFYSGRGTVRYTHFFFCTRTCEQGVKICTELAMSDGRISGLRLSGFCGAIIGCFHLDNLLGMESNDRDSYMEKKSTSWPLYDIDSNTESCQISG